MKILQRRQDRIREEDSTGRARRGQFRQMNETAHGVMQRRTDGNQDWETREMMNNVENRNDFEQRWNR